LPILRAGRDGSRRSSKDGGTSCGLLSVAQASRLCGASESVFLEDGHSCPSGRAGVPVLQPDSPFVPSKRRFLFVGRALLPVRTDRSARPTVLLIAWAEQARRLLYEAKPAP